MAQHLLFGIGGQSRAGKSQAARKIRERFLFVTPTPEELCRPILRYLFVDDIPAGTDHMIFKGVATFGPETARQSHDFDFFVSTSEASAPNKAADMLIELPTDYIRFVIRMIFAGGNFGLSAIGFEGESTFVAADGSVLRKQRIHIDIQGEDPVAWRALNGLLIDYDGRNENNILVEGVALAPENVRKLRLKNLGLRAVFTGFVTEDTIEPLRDYLLAFGERDKDHLYDELIKSGKPPDQFISEWVRNAIKDAAFLRDRVQHEGLQFVGRSEPFDNHIHNLADALLAESTSS
jgi:hypothetical protein